MKALKIEDEAKEIQRYVIKLQKDLKKNEEQYNKLWNSLWTVVNHYNTGYKRLSIIDTDIYKLTSWEAGGNIKKWELDKPITVSHE